MTDPRTSLARGETWVPHGGETAEFFDDFTQVSEAYYRRELTSEMRDQWRVKQLRQVLSKVSTMSAFYRRHLDGIDLSIIRPEDLTSLPFTTKDDLRREMFDALSGDVSEAVYFYETTGTTGPATPCPRDGKDIVTSNSNVTESWRAIFRHHFGDRKPTVGLMGPTEVHSFGDTLGDVAKNAGSCNAKIWPYSPVIGFKKALELMKDLRLEVVVATPGVCLNLARAAEKYGYNIEEDFAALKLFFVTGEMCTDALAKNIDSLWGVTTYNILYGHLTVRMQHIGRPDDLCSIAAGIVARVEGRLKVAVVVDFVDELDEIVSTGAFVSWKAARIVDHRRARTPEDEVAELMSKGRGIDT